MSEESVVVVGRVVAASGLAAAALLLAPAFLLPFTLYSAELYSRVLCYSNPPKPYHICLPPSTLSSSRRRVLMLSDTQRRQLIGVILCTLHTA